MSTGEVTEEQAVRIVDEMFAIPEHWRLEDMPRGEATHITKYSLAVETRHQNDRLISALRELGPNAITFHSTDGKPATHAQAELPFRCLIKLTSKQRADSNTLSAAKDALTQALVGAMNNAISTWLECIIRELEAESQSALTAAVDEINWLHSQIGDASGDAAKPLEGE